MLQWMMELFTKFVNWLLSLLPHSPFTNYIDMMTGLPYLSWLNWFIPVGALLTIMATWLSVIALFYIYSIIMRWVKMIGD